MLRFLQVGFEGGGVELIADADELVNPGEGAKNRVPTGSFPAAESAALEARKGSEYIARGCDLSAVVRDSCLVSEIALAEYKLHQFIA